MSEIVTCERLERWLKSTVLQTMIMFGFLSGTGAQRPSISTSTAIPQTSLTEASALISGGDFRRAEKILRVYVAKDEISGRARFMLAYALLRQNRPAESLAEYTRASTLQKPLAEDLRSVGQDYVLLGDYPDASKWIMRSIEMDRSDPDGWYSLGRLRYTEQRYVDAVECFEHALALAPRSAKAENNLGLAYEGLNRTEDAVIAYRQAIEWQGNGRPEKTGEQPLLNLATVLIHRREFEQALPLLKRALSIAPKDSHILEQLGQLYMHESRFSEAETSLEAAVRIDPDKSNLHFLLGQAYRHLGRQLEAKEQFDAAARLASSSAVP